MREIIWHKWKQNRTGVRITTNAFTYRVLSFFKLQIVWF